ncbi:hypothetical protein [Ensifer sp. ENS04]|uniref:hypothetical protein n=1 Tax=Ensifer sp. ENS04 TaxID=2769281 RepID=UPI001AEDE4F0|nr:hypothetical protein [Ensifer sp. ENS04]
MAKLQAIPLRGATSDGEVVEVREIDTHFLTQIAGWRHFNEVADRALRTLSLFSPKDFRSPYRREGATAWRIAPDRVLIRSFEKPDLASSEDLVTLDLSDARVCLVIEGAGAAPLLSRVIALDFSEGSFPTGTFAQSALHHVGVLVDRTGPEQFTLLIPTTWAVSLTDLLSHHLAKAA